MTEVKHFDDVCIFTDSVVNKNGAMLQLSNAVTLSDGATHAGKPRKQIHVVEKSLAKPHCGIAVVLGNVPNDFGEIVGGIDGVAVRHFVEVEAFLLEPAGEDEIQRAGDARPIQLARLGARHGGELFQRIDVQARGYRDGDDGVGHPRDRHQVARLVGQVVVQEWMRCERRRRREQTEFGVPSPAASPCHRHWSRMSEPDPDRIPAPVPEPQDGK